MSFVPPFRDARARPALCRPRASRSSLCLGGYSVASVRKLLEEPQVVFVKQPDVLDLIPQDRDPLDADAPGEAGVFLGVVADRFEHRGVDHAAAEDFNPAALLAHRAAGAVAGPAAD